MHEPDADEVRGRQEPANERQQVDVEGGLPVRFVAAPEWAADKGLCLVEKGLGVNDGRVEEGAGAVFPQIAQSRCEGG